MATTEVGNLGPVGAPIERAPHPLSEFGRLAARIFAVGGLVVVASFFLAQNANADTGGASGQDADATPSTTSTGHGHQSSAHSRPSLQKVLNSTARDVHRLTRDLGLEQAVGASAPHRTSSTSATASPRPHRQSSASSASRHTSTRTHSSGQARVKTDQKANARQHRTSKADTSRPVTVATSPTAAAETPPASKHFSSAEKASASTRTHQHQAASRPASHDQQRRSNHDQNDHDGVSVDQTVTGLIGAILSTDDSSDSNAQRDPAPQTHHQKQVSNSRSKTSSSSMESAENSTSSTKSTQSSTGTASPNSDHGTSARSDDKSATGPASVAASGAVSPTGTSPVPAAPSLLGLDRLTHSLGVALVGDQSGTTPTSTGRSAQSDTAQNSADLRGSTAQEAPTDPAQGVPTEGLLGVVGGIVRPLTSDIVDPVVTDVAVPVLDDVVEPVAQTVQPVLAQTAGPLVGSIVDPVIDNVAAPVVDQEVSPALAGVVVTVTHTATGTAPTSTTPASSVPSWEQTGTVTGSRTAQLSYQITYRPVLSASRIEGRQASPVSGPTGNQAELWSLDLGAILPQPAGPAATTHGAVLRHERTAQGSSSTATSRPSAASGHDVTSHTHKPASQPVSLPTHDRGDQAPANSTGSVGGGASSAAGPTGIAADTVESRLSNTTGRGPIHADSIPSGPCFGPGCFPD